MQPSHLHPFLRKDLDILFIGLNPAAGSSQNRHYFSVNSALWRQLHRAGLITAEVDKANADELIFGGTEYNYNRWSYGITDLVTSVAESNSRKVNPTVAECQALAETIMELAPRAAVLLHMKVVRAFLPYLGHAVPETNSGDMGMLITGCPTIFFNIAFPHGNAIKSEDKVARYVEVREYLLQNQ